MAFVWSSLSQGVNALPAQISEVRTNINSVRTKIGLSAWTWTQIPVYQGNKLYNLPITEIRSALDDTDNNNVCTANYTTRNSLVYDTQYIIDRSTAYGSNACHEYCVIFWRPNYTTVNTPNGGCATDYSVYQAWHLHYYSCPSN